MKGRLFMNFHTEHDEYYEDYRLTCQKVPMNRESWCNNSGVESQHRTRNRELAESDAMYRKYHA